MPNATAICKRIGRIECLFKENRSEREAIEQSQIGFPKKKIFRNDRELLNFKFGIKFFL